MPLKSGKPTHMERAFIGHYVATRDATYAATQAGYSTPVVAGSRLAAHPGIQAGVLAETFRSLARLRDDAVNVLVRCLDEAKAGKCSHKDARQTAAVVLDQLRKFGDAGETADKEAHEMTAAELAERRRALELQAVAIDTLLAAGATPVDGIEVTSGDDNSPEPPGAFG